MGNLTDLFPVASSNNILESFSAPADGRSVTVKSGTYTLGTVTGQQNGTTTYTLQGAYAEANFTGCVEFVFDLTVSTTNKANGQIAPADWTTAKTIKANYREYSSGYESILHRNKYEDGTSSSGEEVYTKPIITIIAYS